MRNTKKEINVKIIKSEKEPESLELIAAHITAIAHAVQRLKKGPVSDRVIHLLLKDMLPRINITDIKAVLDMAARLDSIFVKK